MNDGEEKWNELQRSLNTIDNFPRPKRRQIWWCVIGLNVGQEQSCSDGFERPVLVLKVFGSMFWGLPITSSDPEGKKESNPLYIKLDDVTYTNDRKEEKRLHGFVALHQLRVFDGRRLKRKILKMDVEPFEVILSEIRRLL